MEGVEKENTTEGALGNCQISGGWRESDFGGTALCYSPVSAHCFSCLVLLPFLGFCYFVFLQCWGFHPWPAKMKKL
jgi:hypothetical protein